MELTYTWISLLPPLIAIVLAMITRKVYLSLVTGIAAGWLILSDFNLWTGFLNTLEGFVNVFQDKGQTRTILFGALVGALILLIQKSGGVAGFIRWVEKQLLSRFSVGSGGRRWVQTAAWLSGIVIFVESSISVLTVGTLFRPLFDRLKISREKLAYIADSSSAPACILIPFNAWGAFIMGLLITLGFTEPFTLLISSIVYNFYPILALLFVPVIIWTGVDFPAMRKAQKRVDTSGELLREGAQPMVSTDLTEAQPVEGAPFRPINMVLPLTIMVALMPLMLAYTGWDAALADRPTADFISQFLYAIGQGSGSAAVLTAVSLAILAAILMYSFQSIMKIGDMVDYSIKGISDMLPLALLMLFAFALSTVCYELNTGRFVAHLAEQWMAPQWVPVLVFLISGFIAFSTGTSWGTFAIMVGIALPLAETIHLPPAPILAAALGGGIFGDHCSPISDTTILSSMASATDHIDHVRTQLPYALLLGGISSLIYIILGYMII
ncbi:MAG: sodium:solute symporter [Bacteroidetes bacterium]|jgi:Na+/H+ antiporter NhaC|nr:sodium:solute symporter [Bacteroidota bacterium]